MTTLKEAIQQAIEEHGNALWSDGGTDWRLDNYIDATRDAWNESGDDDPDPLDAPASYDGRTIRLHRVDGTIDTGEALLRLTATAPTTLDELCDAVNDDVRTGLPRETGETGPIDMSSLPTFGGAEPDDTGGIWSWDETRLLVGSGRLRIVTREEWAVND